MNDYEKVFVSSVGSPWAGMCGLTISEGKVRLYPAVLRRSGSPERIMIQLGVRSNEGKIVIEASENVPGSILVDYDRKKLCFYSPELVEPLKILFKDEVREIGRALGLPANMVDRQPFPGPGLGVRCPGAITRDRLEAVRESDAILREEFAKNGLEGRVWQYFTVVPDFKSTGVKDGKRTFDWPCIIRAINTTDVMEVTVEHLSPALMDHLVNRIIAEVPGINRVLYDFTPKPPATVEYE